MTLNYNASTGACCRCRTAPTRWRAWDFQTSSLGGASFTAISDGATGIFITDASCPRASRRWVRPAWYRSGSNYFLNPVAGGSGPELRFNGAPVVAGQFGASGRRSARSRRPAGMRLPGRSRAPISIRSGTPTATATTSPTHRHGVGNQPALESLETSFHQDLNGDGMIGVPTHGDRGFRFDQPGPGRKQLFS